MSAPTPHHREHVHVEFNARMKYVDGQLVMLLTGQKSVTFDSSGQSYLYDPDGVFDWDNKKPLHGRKSLRIKNGKVNGQHKIWFLNAPWPPENKQAMVTRETHKDDYGVPTDTPIVVEGCA